MLAMTDINDMSMHKLVGENKALKAQVKELREALVTVFNGGWDEEHSEYIDIYIRDILERTKDD